MANSTGDPDRADHCPDEDAEAAARLSEARYRTLFDRAPIGILYGDPESYYLDANECMCEMLGYTREELIGMHATDIIVPSEADLIPGVIAEISADVEHRQEWLFRRKDGTVFPVDVVATKFADGSLMGMVRDITIIREHEIEIDRMTRLYSALSQINQAIVWSASRDELLEKVCEVLVGFGGLKMAWVGWEEAETKHLLPVAQFGDTYGYLNGLTVYTDERPEGRGPSGTAFRTGKSYICNDLMNDPATLPWRETLHRCGFRSSAAFPIRLAGQVCGTIQIYAGEANFFRDREVALLEEAATDVSFALDNFAREAARREAERLLRNEKLFTDTMVESMPGVLYFYDSEGRFIRWNRNFERVTGYSGEEIAGMHPREFFADADRPMLDERIAEVFTTGESSVEAPFISRDGAATPYFFTGRRIEFQERTCLVGVGIDISERLRAEAERERRHQAEEADRIKSAFLATMSHELRTPLNSIIGFTGIVLQGLAGPLNEEQGKQLDMVRTSARHLLALVNDVLDISKIEAGQFVVGCAPFDLRTSINKVVGSVTPLVEARGLALHVMLPSELGTALGDERRFEQILLNLLSNAVKFSDRGGIAVAAELLDDYAPQSSTEGQPAICIRVSDTGMGIRPEDLATLFQPFQQIDSGLSRNHEGTGLGLAICQRLAGLMGGEIRVESEWGVGSTFSILLPLKGPEDL